MHTQAGARMSPATGLRITRIHFFDTDGDFIFRPEDPGNSLRIKADDARGHMDGVVLYNLDHNGRVLTPFQPFQAGQPFRGPTPGCPYNVWYWNGNRESPSLAPSFGWYMGDPDLHTHLYLRDGRIDLLSDSVVTLA